MWRSRSAHLSTSDKDSGAVWFPLSLQKNEVTRIAAPKGAFTLKSKLQYKEYERAALADGRKYVEVF